MSHLPKNRSVLTLLLASLIISLVDAHCAVAEGPQRGRHALVIGNSRYLDADPVSGVKDATLMASHLKQLGFENTELIVNGKRERIRKGLADLGARIPTASAVVVFYSGHGFQKGGKNYLMPTDGTIDPDSAISLIDIQSALSQAPNAVKVVFLDACRNSKGPEPGLNATEVPSLKKTLYAFAAGSGQFSAAGLPDGYSPYSMALLRHLREPGLNVIDLLGKISAELDGFDQVPAFTLNAETTDFTGFYLQPPVILKAEIKQADDSLLVVLNGKVELSGGAGTKGDLRLKAGRNDLELLVYNEKALHNGQTWGRPEGWRYDLGILHEGNEITCGQARCFADEGEKVPLKGGPRHGKVFTASRANLFVSLDSRTVTVKDPDFRAWERESPVWANDQELLDARSLKDLDLSPEDLLDDINLGRWAFLRLVLVEFLKSGKILGQVITDPNDTLFTVRGNQGLQEFVTICMTERRTERIEALKASVQQALDREPSPFVSYDEALAKCIQEVGRHSGLKPEDARISTAVETRRSLNPQ